MPNQNWDDWALTQEFKALDKRLELHEDALKGLSHFPTDVAIAAREIEHLTEEIAKVAKVCDGFHAEWQATIANEKKNRGALIAAVIAGCFVVLAQLVQLVGQLFGGS